ncbi:Protein dispatched 1 [Desmophyllum pertusum]|uniref:Protein dispatched 1 n=1 Tax=Desmophyllum pertusum TaxID=174260 RepID=A0A9X0D0D7_9CNID|nr:Protein dispatched 1 [Desmophyllum pertusum]
MVVQDIPDLPSNGLTPGLGVANHQQLAILDVLGVAVLGTLPGTALGPRNELNKGTAMCCFRSGCAITLVLSGSALADVMGHVGWERAHTASYYMQLEKVLRHDSTSALLVETVDDHNPTSDLARLYQDLNSVKDFVLTFPMGKSGKRKASSEGTT